MQPAFAAAAGQFHLRLARPPPAAKVAEPNVQAHRSAFSYPDAVYLYAISPNVGLLPSVHALPPAASGHPALKATVSFLRALLLGSGGFLHLQLRPQTFCLL